MDLFDKFTFTVLGLGIAAKAAADVASYFEERHDSRLARIVGAAGRVAGSISEQLSALTPGVDPEAVKKALVAAGVDKLRTEFRQSAKVVGATDDKLAGIIEGELGKIPRAAAIAAVAVQSQVSDPLPAAS
jgi:hypothetical protein